MMSLKKWTKNNFTVLVQKKYYGCIATFFFTNNVCNKILIFVAFKLMHHHPTYCYITR